MSHLSQCIEKLTEIEFEGPTKCFKFKQNLYEQLKQCRFEVQVAGVHSSPLFQAQDICKELACYSSTALYGEILAFDLMEEMTHSV